MHSQRSPGRAKSCIIYLEEIVQRELKITLSYKRDD
jgi:hypothetical protein